MNRFNKFNFLIKKDDNGKYQVLQKEYIFNIIPRWKEIKYYENNQEEVFKFDDIIKAQEFIIEICN